MNRLCFLPLLLALALIQGADSETLNFNPGWRFAPGSHPLTGVDDSAWTVVSTPHTYHDRASYQGLKPGTKDLGPHTYRKHFTVPREWAGRVVILEFQGIRQRGTFHLNGALLGRSAHGVTPFGFDITPLLRHDGDNLLQVEIDCSDKDFDSDTRMCWFFPGFNPLYGGICRNVLVHAMPRVHATLPLLSSLHSSGTYVYAEDISTEGRSATIGVEIEVRNDDAQPRPARCAAEIIDREGRMVARLDGPAVTVKAGEQRVVALSARVAGLSFWQPGHPYLYTVRTQVVSDGTTDVRDLTTGFRKIEVRGAEFYLNNRVLMTHGYGPRSQNEWPVVGAAYPDWMHDVTNRMMADGHANMVRWEHTMPSPQDVASCDRMGLLQMMPGADRENDSSGREWELRVQIMRDTIVACRNSPSVVLWEAANNVLSKEHVAEMCRLRDELDPRGSRRPMGGRSEGEEWVSWMYGVRKESQRLSIDSEFLRDEGPRRWWDRWSPPYNNAKGEWKLTDNAGGWNRNQDNMCVMQSIVHEQYYNARPGTGPSVCNGGIQIFFADSDTFVRGCDPFRRSGPVDGMRLPKDAYFCNQTMWSNTPELWTAGEPRVFVPGHWNYPQGTVKPVYVFISPGIDRVRLLRNGRELPAGVRTNAFLVTFNEVAWEAGSIEAEGLDANGVVIARHGHQTAGPAVALRQHLIHGPDGLRADGSDLVIVETEAVDAEGRRCPLDQPLVTYGLTGPALWRGGIWEEDVKAFANKTALPLLNGIHRVVVRSTPEPGRITITASAPGLTTSIITVDARPVPIVGGLSPLLPAIQPPRMAPVPPRYGPDLPPAPRPPPGSFDTVGVGASASQGLIYALTTAFPAGAEVVHGARDGVAIYKDRPWTFAALPPCVQGADFLRVANDDATASAGEGVVFKIGSAGRVYVAYDDGNVKFPHVSSPTRFTKTEDSILINGRRHSLYRSGAMNGGELTYLGTNGWTDQAPAGVNNYVVFVVPGVEDPKAAP